MDYQHDEHEVDDDEHVVDIHMEFTIMENDDGTVQAEDATIQSHVHNVPPQVAAETLVIIAHKMLGEHMAHTVFENCPNSDLAHAMGRASATAFLIEMLKNAPEHEAFSLVVPDDASELLNGD